MKVVIVGCGRVGAVVADAFDRAGHQVIIIDIQTRAFDRLPSSFGGEAIRGNGTDEDVLRRAGATGADLLLALTEGDNRNVMASQVAIEELGVERVIAKINDPVRAEAYSHLGVPTLCRTNMMADAVLGFAGLPIKGAPPIMAPLGSHPGGAEHHRPSAGDPADGATATGDRAGSPEA
jgi:trk system potassium uptake protein TrkA